ncbi:MAG: NifU family protein [Acidobacteria bacterium]|nr:NifU family protein [Acidobacteriota bacterium]
MNRKDVYITANPTPNPESLKFIIDRQIVDGEPITLSSSAEAQGSPLAEKLFALGHIDHLFAFQNFITITKTAGTVVWQDFARQIGQTIREHIQSGDPHFNVEQEAESTSSDPKIRLIKEVLDEIRPSVAMDGGNIVFAGFQDGIVQVFMQGACSGCPSSTITLKAGIEQRLRQVLPDIKGVVAI